MNTNDQPYDPFHDLFPDEHEPFPAPLDVGPRLAPAARDHRSQRVLDLLEQHRVAEAHLLMSRQPVWAAACSTELPADVPLYEPEAAADARERFLDAASRTRWVAEQRQVVLAQIIGWHPREQRRRVLHQISAGGSGPDAQGYEVESLLFRFVPPDDPLAATLAEVGGTLAPRWQQAEVRMAQWHEQPIGFAVCQQWNGVLDIMHSFESVRQHFLHHAALATRSATQEMQLVWWSAPISFEQVCQDGTRLVTPHTATESR